MPDRGIVLVGPAGEREFFYEEQVPAALASGWAPAGDVVAESGLTGSRVQLSGDQYAQMQQRAPGSLVTADPEAERAIEAQALGEQRHGGLGNNIIAAGEGAAGALTLGLSDIALDAAGADTAERAKFASTGRMIGEVGASVATAFSPFGKGAVAKALTATPAGAISKLASGGKTALGRVALAAGEGTAYGVGQAISTVALADPGMTAEQVVSELGQGALLGAALGAGAGALGEGVRAVGAMRSARPAAALDFNSDGMKGVVGDMAKAHQTVDDVVEFAEREHLSFVKSTKDEATAKATQEMLAASPRQKELSELRYYRNELENLVATEGTHQLTVAEPLVKRMNEIALKVGDPRLPPIVWDDIAEAVVEGGAKGQGRQLMSLVKRADGLTTKFEKVLLEDATSAARKLVVDDPALVKAFPRAPREALGLLPTEAVKPESFKRLLKLADREPQKLVKHAAEIDNYFKEAAEAVKGNAVAEMRIAEAVASYSAALERVVPAEAQAVLSDPRVLGSILGIEAGIELLPDETPGKRLLQLAAAYKLVGGVAGLRGAQRSLGKRIANAIGRRAAAGAASGAVRELPLVRGLGSAGQTGAVGAAASAGYEGYGAIQRWMSGRGIKAAMATEAQAKAAVGASVDKVANGAPAKRGRGMPLMNAVLDKLVGEPESKKSPQEKFKVVQDRLAKFTVAPDAVMAGAYEALRPLQEVNEYLADDAESVLGKQFEYLQSIIPKDPGTMIVLGKSMWQPTDRELYEFSQAAAGVLFPLDTIEAISDGLVPPQAAEAIAATNPELFMKYQHGLIERADEVRANSTMNQRIALGLAFKVPLEPTADPRYVTFVQNMHAQKTMQDAAGKAGESSTPEESFSDAQKLLS